MYGIMFSIVLAITEWKESSLKKLSKSKLKSAELQGFLCIEMHSSVLLDFALV